MMLLPSDKEYKATKLIMQGKATMPTEFKPLAAWIDHTYHVKTINIIYDILEDVRPRLQICFEFQQEEASFHINAYRGYNKNKQEAIAAQFKKTMEDQGLAKKGIVDFLKHPHRKKYDTDNVWVIFGAFQPIAKRDAASQVSPEEIRQLQLSLHNEDIWQISAYAVEGLFMVYTDEQVKKYKDSAIQAAWTDKYFDLLKRYDEFNYLDRETFSIHFDSKENFDKNYQGNWYYYYK